MQNYDSSHRPYPPAPWPRGVTLYEHGRAVKLLHLGRAHTDGDLFIYLPQEKVIVTGDAVVDWMPFLGDGYPPEDGLRPSMPSNRSISRI